MRTAIIFLIPLIAAGQSALSKIAGPAIPLGQSPWPWYDSAETGNHTAFLNTALNNIPLIGLASNGTWTLSNGGPGGNLMLTNSGTGASEFVPGQWCDVAWNGASGAGQGTYLFQISSISGNVLYSLANGYRPNMVGSGLSGLTVYHIVADTATNQLINWIFQNGNQMWNYYDLVMSFYHYYQRTGNPTDLAAFRTLGNAWWQWALADGAAMLNPMRASSLEGMFVLALDTHPERLPYIYNILVNSNTFFQGFEHYNGDDDREPGYGLLFNALGARADSTNRAQYCSWLTVQAQEWVTYQTPGGWWPEKVNAYSYIAPNSGESPWRIFATNKGLARAYEDFVDSTCNNPTLAASILTAIEKSAAFIYNAGFQPLSRGIFYDVNQPVDGEDAANNGAGPGTISVSGTTVTGTGTTFTTSFASAGYIGIEDSVGNSWPYPISHVTSDTSLTISGTYGGSTSTEYLVCPSTVCSTPGGALCPNYAPSCYVQLPQTPSGTYFIATASPTNCDTTATYCWNGAGTIGGYQAADPDDNMDAIWIMGWLYNITGNAQYKTWGDYLFASTYGGPAGGAGSGTACGGPNCINVGGVGYELPSYIGAIESCLFTGVPCGSTAIVGNYCEATPPSSSPGYPYCNAYHYFSKGYDQGSGIGAADNYLAWRIGATPPGRIKAAGVVRGVSVQ